MTHKGIKLDYFWKDADGNGHCECTMCTAEYSYKGLPVLVADDDFIEHLHENGFDETIDVGDLVLEWNDWAKENLV